MIWRSVVGKLWGTIILLVVVVLFILTILLLQFFENFIEDQARAELSNLATSIVSIIENEPNSETSMDTVSALVDAHAANAAIIGFSDELSLFTTDKQSAELPASVFEKEEELSRVFREGESVVLKKDFLVTKNGEKVHDQLIIVGTPVTIGQKNGAVYLYQSLGVTKETNQKARYIIYLCAGIAIILTTIFAFFLSSRITAPLRKMREAAIQIAKGKFDAKVPILTHDEIGELALTFNRMGRQLKNFITALNQEKEQLSGVLSSMADGVLTFDRKGSILVSNPPADRFLQIWYYEQGILEGSEEILPHELKDLFQRVVTLEKEQMTEINIQGRSWVVVMTPLYNQSFIRGAVAVLRDMTEERRLDKLREGFIANVSHELRTPIAMLQGYSEAIIDNIANSEEEKREIAQIIYEESLRMGRLVNELLDIARMESGHVELHYEDFMLNNFLGRITRKFQGPAKEKEIALKLNSPVDVELNADNDRLEQVLTNLIDNALRHTQNGGTVILSAKVLDTGIKFDVEDTGVGIPEEDLPFVFERFYKADKARTRGRSGTGLGLAIAKNIVESHGGHITANSKIGEGTTFSFFIPRKIEE